MTIGEMIINNIQNIAKGAAAQPEVRGGNGTAAGGYPLFADILGNKAYEAGLSKAGLYGSERLNCTGRNGSEAAPAAVGARSGGNCKDGTEVTAKDERKPAFLTYRDAKENAGSTVCAKRTALRGETPANAKSTDEQDNDSGKNTLKDNPPNNILQALSQIIGLDKGDLLKLLKEARITPESFNCAENIGDNVSRLSELLGLNDRQSNTLTTLLQMAEKVLKATDSALANEITAKNPDTGVNNSAVSVAGNEGCEGAFITQGAELKGVDAQIANTGAKEAIPSLIEMLARKIKGNLDELSNRLQSDEESAEAELKQMLFDLSGKAGMAEAQETAQQNGGESSQKVYTEPETAAVTEKSSEAVRGNAGQNELVRQLNGSVAHQTTAAPQDIQPQAIFAAMRIDRLQKIGPDFNATMVRMPTEAGEIIKQIVEKAKVVLTQDKSEMVMDLKPESLGRISLKVVTENGAVMAKFLADSQQVRQVLESNMQLLKDSLERQGMNVQGFSVSVRQDSGRQNTNWTRQDGGRTGIPGDVDYRVAEIAAGTDSLIRTAGANPYFWNGSTINLTA